MALVPLGTDGRMLAEEFSRRSPKYDEQAFDKKWRSLQKSPGNVKSIFVMAMTQGWKNPGFRNTEKRAFEVFTDRDFGRCIAAVIADDCAAVEKIDGAKRRTVFLKWHNDIFQPVQDVERRNIVERAAKAVLKGLSESNKLAAENLKFYQLKVGRNKDLDEVCDHVAEALLPLSVDQQVRNFPYFAVGNGVLNLLSQQLVPPAFRAVPTGSRSSVVFDPAAKAPIFEKTLCEIFEGNTELINFFLRLMGYVLLGRPVEQIFIVLYGPGAANGKSTLLEAIQTILGEYFVGLPTAAIMTKSQVSDAATPSLARLEGARLAYVSEPNAKHAFDPGLVKQLTGDSTLTVRGNYADPRDIPLTHVLVMATNVMPTISEGDNGIWRRICVIPFNRTFAPDEQDKGLAQKLRGEVSGILNLLLAGIRDYMTNGLNVPEMVRTLAQEQRNAVDQVAQFLGATMVAVEGAEMSMKDIYPIYQNWWQENPNFLRLTKQELGKRLEREGFKKVIRQNLPRYAGLRKLALG